MRLLAAHGKTAATTGAFARGESGKPPELPGEAAVVEKGVSLGVEHQRVRVGRLGQEPQHGLR